jgi:UDP-N-acetylmuramate dehydrogenase
MFAGRHDMSLEHEREKALETLGTLGQRDVPIGPMTTYRVGGRADVFVRVTDRAELPTVAHALEASGLPLLIIGRGSNLLVADAGFRGIAVSIAGISDGIDIDADAALVTAGSGVLLPVLARRTAAAGLTGFEWAVGVPGSVGGAVRMNAGGHGSDMSASLVSVTIADLAGNGTADRDIVHQMNADQLGLRFRGSALKPTQLVVDATLQLAVGDRAAAEAELSDIVQWRRANQPGGQNAGSVFVNPVPGEVTCGALIDEAGLRGYRHGTATVSDKHANFIQADDDGSADDVRELMHIVRERVEEASGWRLRSEIRLVGFEDEF